MLIKLHTDQYGTVAAWENRVLEASSSRLVAHSLQEFDYERARADLGVQDSFDVMAMIAIVKENQRKTFNKHVLKRGTNGRKRLSEIVMEGHFTKK